MGRTTYWKPVHISYPSSAQMAKLFEDRPVYVRFDSSVRRSKWQDRIDKQGRPLESRHGRAVIDSGNKPLRSSYMNGLFRKMTKFEVLLEEAVYLDDKLTPIPCEDELALLFVKLMAVEAGVMSIAERS